MTRNTHTGFRAIGRGAAITCLNDLGLSQPENEPRSSVCEANVVQYDQKYCGWYAEYMVIMKEVAFYFCSRHLPLIHF